MSEIETSVVVGSTIRASVTFTPVDSVVATDPTTVTCKVRTPSGTTTTYTYAGGQITKDSTGVYHKDIELTEVGFYWIDFEGTGTVDVVQQVCVKSNRRHTT